MRWLFLIPDLTDHWVMPHLWKWAPYMYLRSPATKWLVQRGNLLSRVFLRTTVAWGGTLNIMRHAALARDLGADAYLCTLSGKDTYGEFSVVDLPFAKWSDRRSTDVVVFPEFACRMTSEHDGPCVVYLQVPNLEPGFDYMHPRVSMWTDSPFMLDHAQRVYPGKDIPIVPNIVDPKTFPYRPQSERTDGLLFAFPRKEPEFIAETERRYREMGGTFWRFELIDGLPLHELARRMQEAQVFLASAVTEGCALPPQESMACGMVVVGRSARGANFSMQHKETAMIAETPAEAAHCLRELEQPQLRDHLSRNGHAFISRYFPENEPTEFWRQILREYGDPSVRDAALGA
jgi:hypothetical protein